MQPAARAGAILAMIWCSGKFHGVIAATTPTGSFWTMERPTRWSFNCCATSKVVLMSPSGNPICAAAKADRAAHFGCDESCKFVGAGPKFPQRPVSEYPGGRSAEFATRCSKAERAAATALSASSRHPAVTLATSISVAGLMTAILSAEADASHVPPI